MKNFLSKIKKNKKIVFIIIIVLVLLIVLYGVFFRTNEKKLEKTLKDWGKDFYENYYYDLMGDNEEERSNEAKKYEDMGIKIDLDNLSRYNEDDQKKIEMFVNSKTKEECNKYNTRVIIFPNGSYGKKNYKVEVELDCGFN